jgi:hypothetical protein
VDEECRHAIHDHPLACHPVTNAALGAAQSPKKDIHHPRLIYAPENNPAHPVTFDFVSIPKHTIWRIARLRWVHCCRKTI